jgi:transposase-like protein
MSCRLRTRHRQDDLYEETRSKRSIARSRKIIKTSGSFPNDDAALTLLYLAIKNAACEGSKELHGQPRWGSLPFSSARVFLVS